MMVCGLPHLSRRFVLLALWVCLIWFVMNNLLAFIIWFSICVVPIFSFMWWHTVCRWLCPDDYYVVVARWAAWWRE